MNGASGCFAFRRGVHHFLAAVGAVASREETLSTSATACISDDAAAIEDDSRKMREYVSEL